jgi:hypothetical protein
MLIVVVAVIFQPSEDPIRLERPPSLGVADQGSCPNNLESTKEEIRQHLDSQFT